MSRLGIVHASTTLHSLLHLACGTNNTIFLLVFLGPAEMTEITEILINGD